MMTVPQVGYPVIRSVFVDMVYDQRINAVYDLPDHPVGEVGSAPVLDHHIASTVDVTVSPLRASDDPSA